MIQNPVVQSGGESVETVTCTYANGPSQRTDRINMYYSDGMELNHLYVDTPGSGGTVEVLKNSLILVMSESASPTGIDAVENGTYFVDRPFFIGYS